jgi:hypothetical protein
MLVTVQPIMAMCLGMGFSVLVRAAKAMVVIVGNKAITTTMMAAVVLDTTVITIPADLVRITISIQGMQIVGMLLLFPDCLNSTEVSVGSCGGLC